MAESLCINSLILSRRRFWFFAWLLLLRVSNKLMQLGFKGVSNLAIESLYTLSVMTLLKALLLVFGKKAWNSPGLERPLSSRFYSSSFIIGKAPLTYYCT